MLPQYTRAELVAPPTGKYMLPVFWNSQDMVLKDFVQKGVSITYAKRTLARKLFLSDNYMVCA